MEKTKQDILYWSKRLYQKGFMPATSGNVSVKKDGKIIISRSGCCSADMTEDDLVLMDLNGNPLEQGKKPSSEKLLHVYIYEIRSDIKAIVHSHCPYITAFAATHKEIDKHFLADFTYEFDKIPVAPYYLPSSIELAQKTSDYFDKYSCVLMANHGVVIGSDSVQNCFYKLESIKNYIETYFAAEMLGGAKEFNKKQIKEIKSLRK